MFTGSFFEIKLHLLKYVLSYSVDFKAPWELWNPLNKRYPVNFTSPTGIVNATVYKTEPNFTGLRHGKLSKFLSLNCASKRNISTFCLTLIYIGIIFMNAPNQWEMTFHCNVISHWLGACTKWSLYMYLWWDFFVGFLQNWGLRSLYIRCVLMCMRPITQVPLYASWHMLKKKMGEASKCGYIPVIRDVG